MKLAFAAAKFAALFCCPFAAAAGPSEDCTHPRTAATVQHLLYANYLPPSYRAKVSEQFFRDGTIVKLASAISYNRDVKLATCVATFAVDASYGLDRDTDRALQYMFARDPGFLMALMGKGTERLDENHKLYGFRIQYTVQPISRDTMVRTAPVSEIQMSLVGGFLITIPQSVR